jgi:outer membrane receptor for ferrienterochelin and colicins
LNYKSKHSLKYQILIFLLFFSASFTFAQNRVKFEVREETGETLIGVNILVKGTVVGAVTGAEGKAILGNLPDGKVEIRISYLGFKGKEIILNFPQDNDKTIEVELEEDREELEEVTIATTRSSRTIEDIPTRIEVITSEELGEKAAMNSSNIGMLLSETTGVQMQQTSLGSGNLSIRIQGLDGRYTQIIKDGFPLYEGFAGGLSIMQIPPLDLKQVELIKGSNSTLYGGGAIAGLVNLVSIVPEEDPELSIMLNQTSALGTSGNVFYAQKFKKTGLSFYGAASNQIAYDPDKDGFSNIPQARTYNFNPKFYLYFDHGTELNFGLNTTFDDRIGGDMQVIKGNASEENVFSEKNHSNRYATQLFFQNTTENRTISIKNSFSYFDRKLVIPDYVFRGKQLSGFSEILFRIHRNEKTEWQFGANHYSERFIEEKRDSFPVRDYRLNTIGGFAQSTTNIGNSFILEGGLRTDYNKDYGVFFLPRIALLFKPNQKITSRIGGALGYKLPTIFTEDAEKLYFSRIEPLEVSNMNPETSIGGNFDINYKTSFLDKFTFSVNQLFYITRLKNSLVLRESGPQNGYFYENADGNILSTGFETNLKLSYGNFKFYVNYAFVSTQLLYDNINNQKPLTPKHNAGFVLYYEVEDKWSAGYELYYTGSQFDELYDQKPEFWVMGIMIMRHFKKLAVFINFENFTNAIQTKYEPLVLPPYNSPSFPDIWAPSDGFVFNGGLRWRIF